jgi:sigma-B regulation protein RsbU (phosphoserine phosphatase)
MVGDSLVEPFVPARSQASKEGLGLGLYIAAEIARAHKGALEFRSDPAETCFTLKLPFGA